MRLKSVLALAVACAGIVSVAALQNTPQLPPPFKTPSAANPPRVIPQPNGVQLRLPAGFDIRPFADGLQRPRFMLLGPNREILLTQSTQDGSVLVLTDRDGDGRAESRSVLLDGLDRPYGMAFWKEYLYVAEPGSLKRYKYDAASAKAATPGQEVVSLQGLDGGHWTRTVLFDRKGEKLYLTVGSGSNVNVGEDPRRAAINRYNPDGTGHEIFASGLRNAIGLRWYPGTDYPVGRSSGTRHAGRRPRAGLLHFHSAERVLRLALRLHRCARGSAGTRGKRLPGCVTRDHRSGCPAAVARRRARRDFLHGQELPAASTRAAPSWRSTGPGTARSAWGTTSSSSRSPAGSPPASRRNSCRDSCCRRTGKKCGVGPWGCSNSLTAPCC